MWQTSQVYRAATGREIVRLVCAAASLVLTACISSHALAAGTPLSSLPGTGSLAPTPGADDFRFIVAGDNRPHKEGDGPTPTIGQIFDAAPKLHPAFVFLCGDTIYGKNPGNQTLIGQEYAAFLKIAQASGLPVFNAPGNHEMDDANDVPNATMQTWYAQFMAQAYASFDYGNSHFIALNTEEVAPPGTTRSEGQPIDGGKTLDPGYVSAAQLAWLKQDLADNASKAHIFIFMHHPMKPKKAKAGLDAASTSALEQLFAGQKNISYVVAAHEHLYFNPQGKNGTEPPPSRKDPSKDPPVYLVSGGAGAPLSGKKKHGGYFHYLIFDVKKDEVKVQLVPLGD